MASSDGTFDCGDSGHIVGNLQACEGGTKAEETQADTAVDRLVAAAHVFLSKINLEDSHVATGGLRDMCG